MFTQFSTFVLALQNDPGQAVTFDPNQSLNFWLVIAGIVIIVFCLLTVFVPYIKDVTTKLQEFTFSRLGISMKVSILTVFVMMGFILSLSSFALQWRGYVKQAGESAQKIAELNGSIKQLEQWKIEKLAREDRARTFDMSILLKPQLEQDEVLDENEWTCRYRLDNLGRPSDWFSGTIQRAGNGSYLRMLLNNITADTRLYDIQLIKGKQAWTTGNVKPLADGIWEAQLLQGRKS